MSDIDTAVADSLKVLDPRRPIREADIESPARRSYRAGLLGAAALVEIVNDAAVRWINKMHATVSVIIAVSAH